MSQQNLTELLKVRGWSNIKKDFNNNSLSLSANKGKWRISIQASHGHYSYPRIDDSEYYSEVEVAVFNEKNNFFRMDGWGDDVSGYTDLPRLLQTMIEVEKLSEQSPQNTPSDLL